MIAKLLDRALRAAGIPIIGVVIGKDDDKATWEVQFKPEASNDQWDEAMAMVEAFDPGAPEVIEAAAQAEATPNRREVTGLLFAFYARHGKWPTAEERAADVVVWREAYTRAGAPVKAAPRRKRLNGHH